ncbi:MAG TPA: hypothetical protein VJZ75_06790 [Candidatus Bathyarchaeia archaeon]|nr:hypothetical protein [Candidatus Bathyarchaeia archaeon]
MQIASQLHNFQSSNAIIDKMGVIIPEGSGKPGAVFRLHKLEIGCSILRMYSN